MKLWELPEIFDRHCAIEASAGTGKTYTLVQLVREIIEQGKATIEKILIVTYTEKAAGELRERLFKVLQDRLEESGKASEKKVEAEIILRLRNAVENFETAGIFTIHGFCQRVLQQYSFENRLAGESDLVDDKTLYPIVLKNIQRRDWPAWMGKDVKKGLAFFWLSQQTPENWEQDVVELAGNWVPEAGDILLPEYTPEDFGKKTFEKGVETSLRACREKARKVLSEAGGAESFFNAYQGLNVDGRRFRRKDITNKLLRPFFEWAEKASSTAGQTIVSEFKDCCYSIWASYSRFNTAAKPNVIPAADEWKDAVDNTRTACPHLTEVSDVFEESRSIFENYLEKGPALFKAVTIRKIKADAGQYKIRHGLLSYQDMLSRVWRALEPEEPESQLGLVLRQRYHFAFVDEFQDTDSLQWRIFRKIFTEKEKQKVFLIGDPKQSIYRFRGADVNTYWKAKAAITASRSGVEKDLNENWRSSPQLLSGLNTLFEKGNWFDGNAKIKYRKVNPAEDNHRIGVSLDNTGRAPITVMTIRETDVSTRIARHHYSKFIADEIESLLAGSNKETSMRIRDDKVWRFLKPSDICILVRYRGEASVLEKLLKLKNIPYTFYKQPGIWQTKEALEIKYLIQAITLPGDKPGLNTALMTRFFRVPPQHLMAEAKTPEKEAGERRIVYWAELAADRNWPKFFSAVFRTSEIREFCARQQDGERIMTNYSQLFQELEKSAVSENMDIQELASWMDRKYRNAVTTGEEEYHKIETEKPKVKLMTMHASKGLEFPVVFVLGGLTRLPFKNNYLHYFKDGHVHYNLEKSDKELKRLNDQESHLENEQLLYVSLTRAQYKLYIPKYLQLNGTKVGNWCGPTSIILHSTLEKAWPDEDCNNIIRHITFEDKDIRKKGDCNGAGEPVWEKLKPNLSTETKSESDGPGSGGNSQKEVRPVQVEERFTDLPDSFEPLKLEMASFTSLHHKAGKAEEQAQEQRHDSNQFGESPARQPDEPVEGDVDEIPEAEPIKDPWAELPRGERTGSMIHEILEEIDYAAVGQCGGPEDLLKNNQAAELIDNKMKSFRFFKSEDDESYQWRHAAAEMVYKTLTTPLEEGFRLCDLRPGDRIHEMEFWYPWPDPASLANIADTGIRYDVNGYLNGFMDLVFIRNGKFYLLDWKSNYLKDGYEKGSLEQGMNDSHYKLQYRIYVLALKRWLAQCGREEEFGGVYYLFLRGMDGRNADKGVYRDMTVTDRECLDNIQPLLRKK